MGALLGRTPSPERIRRMAREANLETDIVCAEPTGDDCVICLQVIVDDCVRTPCGHHFHRTCLDQYLLSHSEQGSSRRSARRARCPICRGSMRLPLAVDARATSGLAIDVVDVPDVDGYCHWDRDYRFLSLGDFRRPGMMYVLTSNDDRRTAVTESMWILEANVPVTIHLNFRSDRHVVDTGVEAWLEARGWERNLALRSVVTSGFPNGPYSGPVFSQACEPGIIELMGSNTWEGVYFVFIEFAEYLGPTLPPATPATALPRQSPDRQTGVRRPFLRAAFRLSLLALRMTLLVCIFECMRRAFPSCGDVFRRILGWEVAHFVH